MPEETYGPIDFVLLEFPGDRQPTGEVAAEVLRLVELGVVRLYDAVVIRKELDGTFSGVVLDEVEGFAAFTGARSGLIGDDDVAEAAEALAPGTVAALLVYENAWAIPFVDAVRRNGGELVASARIPAQDIMDALDALEA